ncbi:uncharacterized protein TNCV_4793421 [Trichonephila clavipes]|nr:uncharacterized protein TNCV_4793421 [Trichonephila clavipes]
MVVTWTTPELAPPSPNYHTTPHQREDASALDRFNVHRCPTRRVFSGTGLELVTRLATIQDHPTLPDGKVTTRFKVIEQAGKLVDYDWLNESIIEEINSIKETIKQEHLFPRHPVLKKIRQPR